MSEENKNIKLDDVQKKQKDSSMQNDELVIAPISDESGISMAPNKEDLNQSLQQSVQPVAQSDARVVAKPETEKKKDIFDMQLKNLSEKKDDLKKDRIIKSETKPLRLFVFRKTNRRSILEAFVGTVSFVLFAAILFAASVFADISYDSYQKESIHEGVTLVAETPRQLLEGDQIEGGAVIIAGQRGLIRIGNNAVVTLESIDEDSKTYTFNLEKGSLWGNTLFDESSFVIKTPYANLYAQDASFSVVLDDTKTTVYSDKYDIRVDILADNKLVNTLWIAEGNQAQLLHSKIDSKKETIEKLLYSKLIKEFNYGRLNDKKKKEDPWLVAQMQDDLAYYNMLRTKFTTDVSAKGLKTVSVKSLRSQAKSLLTDLRSALTFNEKRKNEQMLTALFENIDDANYLFLQGNEVDGKVRLSLFNTDFLEFVKSADKDAKKELFDVLVKRYYDLSLFAPGDEMFPVRQSIFDKLLDPSMDQFMDIDTKFILLTDKLNDVYEAVDSNPVDLNSLFAEYFDLYDKYTKSYSGKMVEIGEHIIHQNILVDNLLFQTPELYKLEFFDKKKGMEADYLLALSSNGDKKEQRQTFIGNDIDLLSRIRYFLFNERLDAADARQIVYRLIKDIEDYQEETVDIAAVNELFNKRLADFGVFWEYLQATEYSSTQLHGASHSERFEAFKKIQEEVLSFEDIRNEILGSGEISEESIEEILNKSEKDLKEAGILDIEFGSYTDNTKTKIPILSARVGGIQFRATYDWDRQLVSNIIVNNTVISQDGVKLFKVKKFITETMASLSRAEEKRISQSDSSEEADEFADVKRVASVFLAEKFSKMGMVITTDNIEILDLDAGNYKVNDVYFKEKSNAKFSFEYTTSDDKVSNLVVQTKNGNKVVDDTFPSMFINDLVLKIYDESN